MWTKILKTQTLPLVTNRDDKGSKWAIVSKYFKYGGAQIQRPRTIYEQTGGVFSARADHYSMIIVIFSVCLHLTVTVKFTGNRCI